MTNEVFDWLEATFPDGSYPKAFRLDPPSPLPSGETYSQVVVCFGSEIGKRTLSLGFCGEDVMEMCRFQTNAFFRGHVIYLIYEELLPTEELPGKATEFTLERNRTPYPEFKAAIGRIGEVLVRLIGMDGTDLPLSHPFIDLEEDVEQQPDRDERHR